MEIEIHPVGFGECIKFVDEATDRRNVFLLECGSANKSSASTNKSHFAYQNIARDFESGNIQDVLITHFHEDHFNGLLFAHKVLTGIATPEFASPSSLAMGCAPLNTLYCPHTSPTVNSYIANATSRLLTLLPISGSRANQVNSFIQFMVAIPDIFTHTRLLKQGDTFWVMGKEMRVLAPLPHISQSTELQNIVFKAEPNVHNTQNNVLLPNDALDSMQDDKLLTSLDSILEEEFRAALTSILNYSDIPLDAVDEAHAFSDMLLDRLDNLSEITEHNVNASGLLESAQTLRTTASSIRGSLASVKKNDNGAEAVNVVFDNLEAYLKREYDALKSTMNELSVVFTDNESMLFTGDTTINVIEELHANHLLKDEYEIIKIPHHGTKTHHTNLIPKYKLGIISAGKYSNRKIALQYPCDLCVSPIDKVICCTAKYSPKADPCEPCKGACEYYDQLSRLSESCVDSFRMRDGALVIPAP